MIILRKYQSINLDDQIVSFLAWLQKKSIFRDDVIDLL